MQFRFQMKKFLFTLISSLLFLTLSAQDFEIVGVESLPADMSAREEMKADHNDRQCALLRIATQNIAPEQRERFIFKADLGSEVVERASRMGEIWLWVSPGLKYLRILHPDWGQYELRLIDHVARVEALHTYKITIKGTLTLPLQEQGNKVPTQISLIDAEADSKLLEEAYQRKLKDIRASHILIRCDKNALPSDTLKAYNKALDLRKRALKGEDFGELAVRYSDDPSAKDTKATDQTPARPGNKGDLGYFTVFDMVYPFETGAYNTKEGDISMPVRSDFGYHIIKVTSVSDAMGNIQAAHIFLQLPYGASKKDETAMKQKADNIYYELMAQDGKNWNDLVKQYSDDKGTVADNGTLREFTVSRIVPEFVEVCKSLEIGQIAKPVRTYYGFHIIKLLKKTGVGSFEEESQGLRERIEKDMRSKRKN